MTLPTTMNGVYLTGHGGPERLEYRTDIPLPMPKDDEVLIRVLAAGVNNTDINTRIGWYSKSITGATEDATSTDDDADASWTGRPLVFPRIQGADVCGEIAAVGRDVNSSRIGERVIVRTMQSPEGARPYECITFGSETDGGFAQFCTARASETYAIECDWSPAELASIPCAYSTAENALHRAKLASETLLITGASGGVGSAAIQLAKRRGARVIAVCSESKAEAVKAIGADQIIFRGDDLVKTLGENSVDIVYDLVAGPQFSQLLDVLKIGGRYVTSGAIAGPICEIDIRTLYLKDLTLMGTTFQEEIVFRNLINYIENGEIKPLVAARFALKDITKAQEKFIEKSFVGKLVLIPDLSKLFSKRK